MIRTRRWNCLVLVALWLAALGVVFRSTLLLSLATAPITFVAYAALAREPPTSIDFERSLDPESPLPGDDVSVALTVTNAGDRTISDLRVVDGVPDGLGVAGGDPRAGLLLRPGASETIEYAVTARRGEHEFDPVQYVAYTASGTIANRSDRSVETVLECRRPVDDLPLAERTSLLVGRLATDTGGSGVEFHSQREYRPADARSRIDWRRFAKTGDLATVEYRQHRSASVHLLLDTRPPTFRCAGPAEPTAVEYLAYAGELCFNALLEADHRAGVGFYPSDPTAVSIGAGPRQALTARAAFDDHEALDPPARTRPGDASGYGRRHRVQVDLPAPADDTPPERGDAVRELLTALPSEAQTLAFTPLLDDGFDGVVNALRAHSHGVRVVSPDVTDGATVGGAVAAHHRQIRIRSLREREVAVIDWRPEEPLSAELGRIL